MKSKAFSLAEIMIVTIIIGAIAALTIPTTMQSIKYRQNITAYKTAFSKIKNVYSIAPLDGGEVKRTDVYAHHVWAAFYDTVPSIGFVRANNGGNADNSGVDLNTALISIKSSNLKSNARWSSNNHHTKINCDDKTGGITCDLGQTSGYSPWIVLENGMSFTFLAENGRDGIETCAKSVDFMHKTAVVSGTQSMSLGNFANANACVAVIVDINGPDKGPNRLGPNGVIQNETSVYDEVKNTDRFRIYILKDGVSSGPDGLLEHWMMNTK